MSIWIIEFQDTDGTWTPCVTHASPYLSKAAAEKAAAYRRQHRNYYIDSAWRAVEYRPVP